MPAYKVPGRGQAEAAKAARWNDAEFGLRCPALVDWLGCASDGEGHPRERGTLLVFTEGSWLKACVTDRQTGYRAFVSGAGWDGLLAAVEEGLRSGDLDWRAPKAVVSPRK